MTTSRTSPWRADTRPFRPGVDLLPVRLAGPIPQPQGEAQESPQDAPGSVAEQGTDWDDPFPPAADPACSCCGQTVDHALCCAEGITQAAALLADPVRIGVMRRALRICNYDPIASTRAYVVQLQAEGADLLARHWEIVVGMAELLLDAAGGLPEPEPQEAPRSGLDFLALPSPTYHPRLPLPPGNSKGEPDTRSKKRPPVTGLFPTPGPGAV